MDTTALSKGQSGRRLPAEAWRGLKRVPGWLQSLGAATLRRLLSPEEIPCAVEFQEERIFWALRNLPAQEALKHFLICGTTGSGKTTAIRLFLQSIAPRFRPGEKPPEQLIIYDAKCDAVPQLAAMGLRPEDDNVWILNPVDARGAVWNLSEAVQEPVMARHLATLLVPEERNSTAPFFTDAARELVYAVVLGLNTSLPNTGWTFRDLLCALDSSKHISGVVAHDPRAKCLAERVLEDDKHASGVLSTLATKLGPFEQVAALWHTSRSGRRFSISDFLSRPGVLVLGYDPVLKESLWPVNALMIRALTQEILRRPNTDRPRHWFVLDEFPSMERVELHELLNRGRSKGASVLLGIANVSGLRHTYGEARTEDMLSLCTSKCFLRAGDATTAEWASKHIGQVRRIETSYTESTGSTQGSSQSVQYSLQDRSALLPSFFLDLPLPETGGLYGMVSDVPCLGRAFVDECPADELFGWCLPPDDAVLAVDRRRSISEQKLRPWDEDEEKFFCLQTKEPPKPTEEKEPPKPAEERHKPTARRRRKE